jgi:hypothetical protein
MAISLLAFIQKGTRWMRSHLNINPTTLQSPVLKLGKSESSPQIMLKLLVEKAASVGNYLDLLYLYQVHCWFRLNLWDLSHSEFNQCWFKQILTLLIENAFWAISHCDHLYLNAIPLCHALIKSDPNIIRSINREPRQHWTSVLKLFDVS